MVALTFTDDGVNIMKRFAMILVLSTGLAAAPAMAGKRDDGVSVGGAIGATVGAFLGSKVGDGKGRLVTTAAGAVGGYIIGENVAHNGYGRHGGWHGHHRYGQKMRIYPIREPYYATTTSNVRAGPSTRFGITGRLYRHERVEVVGKVGGRDWYLIHDHGRRGFVYAPLLRPTRYERHRGWDHDRWDHDRHDRWDRDDHRTPGRRDWDRG